MLFIIIQYLQNVDFSLDKDLNDQNHSSSDSHHPITPQQNSSSPLTLNTIWKTLINVLYFFIATGKCGNRIAREFDLIHHSSLMRYQGFYQLVLLVPENQISRNPLVYQIVSCNLNYDLMFRMFSNAYYFGYVLSTKTLLL